MCAKTTTLPQLSKSRANPSTQGPKLHKCIHLSRNGRAWRVATSAQADSPTRDDSLAAVNLAAAGSRL
jgi:hypothetical protein